MYNIEELVRRDIYRNLKKLVGTHITKEELINTMRIINLPQAIEMRKRIEPFIDKYFTQAWVDRNILLKG